MPPSQAGPGTTEHPQDKGDPRQHTTKTGDAQDTGRRRPSPSYAARMRVPPTRWHHGPWVSERGPKRVRAGRGTQGGA